jgi:peptidoglycan hydrolase-like protein with peptidoglycan-binding domain
MYERTRQPDPDVGVFQRALGNHGFNLSCDGRFGPGTENAVMGFQEQKGLDVDGKVGPKTWSSVW